MFPIICNKQSKKEIKKAIPLTTVSKKIPRNKFKQGDERHTENYKTLVKEIKEGLNKWRDTRVHG